MLLVKNASYLVYLDLAKLRLAVMLSDFAEKKETFLTINNIIFQSPKNSILFSKGLTYAFGQKMPNSFLFRFGQNKTSKKMLSDVAEKKETCFDYKKQTFLKSKNSSFSKGLAHAFDQKIPFFFSI